MLKSTSLAVAVFACLGSLIAAEARLARVQKTTANLTNAERSLAANSRTAIIATGISKGYFDRHFALLRVVNRPGDRRIVWTFTINEYSTTVTDVLGYYTKDGQRVDTHSVTTTLGRTSDIAATISKRRANQIMQQCIGPFAHPSIEYRASTSGAARLLFTAEARRRPETRVNENDEREREKRAEKTPGSDVIEGGRDDGPAIITGTVDLQTGNCTKGQLVVAP